MAGADTYLRLLSPITLAPVPVSASGPVLLNVNSPSMSVLSRTKFLYLHEGHSSPVPPNVPAIGDHSLLSPLLVLFQMLAARYPILYLVPLKVAQTRITCVMNDRLK